MMNPVIYQLKIDLATAKKEKKELELKVSRLFLELQNYINPYYTSYDQIKAEEIEQLGDELATVKSQLITLQTRMNNICNDLGEENG